MENIDNEVLKAVKDAFVVSKTDLQGVITYVNDLFCTLTGFTREELVGQPHNIVRHPAIAKEVYKDMWDTIQAGEIWTGVVPNCGKGGVLYVVDTTVQPIKNEAGEIVEYISVRRVINDLMGDYDSIEFAKEQFDEYYD
ncbi:PAS domain-containing protein [Psychrobacter sp. HD31]|uniref:PAS domain-containing protein n=1 Tax=Psychrobacter sp. HD31 TaxID=3112003 RepID=UPI003DA60375